PAGPAPPRAPIPAALPAQPAGQGRHDRDAALGRIGLVGAHDLVADLLAALVLEEHRRGERDPLARRRRVDDLGVPDLPLELGDAPLDEALLFTGRVVLRVPREVAVRPGLGDGLGDRVALDPLQPVELVTEPLEAGARHRRALDGHALADPSATRRPRPASA